MIYHSPIANFRYPFCYQKRFWCKKRFPISLLLSKALLIVKALSDITFGCKSARLEPLGTEEVLQGLRKGDSIRRVGPGSWSDKTQLIIWVLHEALLQKEQKALSKASTISLARDARRSRLMVRFGSCSSDFKTQVGILGVEKGGGDRAGQIT